MLLELNQIKKSYVSPSGTDSRTILNEVNLAVSHGESVAVLGPSGSGKSTLLNIIGALDRPDSGTVVLEGRNLERLSSQELAGVRNQKIGFIFQLHHLLPQCTVLENVLIPTIPLPADKKKHNHEERAQYLLNRVGLDKHYHHYPSQLSGGEQQRVAVVRALINQPVLVLADEPTGSLDRGNAHKLTHLLVELNREEKTSLITVTHSAELAGQMQATFSLDNGKLKKV